MDEQDFKHLCLKLFVLFLFYTVQREDATQIKPQLKVEINDGREAP